MNELKSAVSMRSSNAVHDGMCLLLHTGALTTSESSAPPPSSCSSFSSSGGGGASPDSMCSTRSLSGGDADGPLDMYTPDGMMGRKMATRENDSGIQSPEFGPDGNGNGNENSNENGNENSVSIYLDANGDSWRGDLNDHNISLALTHCHGDDHGGRSSDGSSVTEPPSGSSEDEEGDDEEDSFLSLSSVDMAMRGQSKCEERPAIRLASRLDVGPVRELHLEAMDETAHIERTASEPLATGIAKETSVGANPSPPNQEPPKSAPTLPDDSCISEGTDTGKQVPGGAKPPADRGRVKLSVTTSVRTVLKRFPRPELKNVRAKVICRTASAPRPASPMQPRTSSGQSARHGEKMPLPTRGRTANRREQGGHGAKKSRSSSNQMRTGAQVATSATSDPKSNAAPPHAEKRPQSSIRTPCWGSEVIADGDQEPMCEEVTQQEQRSEESPSNKVQTVSSKLTPPAGTRATPHSAPGPPGGRQSAPSREPRAGAGACVSVAGRAVLPAGVPKMKVVDSSGAGCGHASSWKTPQTPSPSKLPIKGAGLHTSVSSSSLGSTASENTAGPEERCSRPFFSTQGLGKPTASKPPTASRLRITTGTVKSTSAGQKAPVLVCHTKTSQNGLQRSVAARPNRPTTAAVEKNTRGGRAAGGRAARVQLGPAGGAGNATHAEEDEERELHLQIERRDRCISQLRELVAHGNRRVEALALVVQHIFSERDEAVRQRNEFNLQLKNLQEELATSASCCERLEREKDQVSVAMETAVQELQDQHGVELVRLQEVLRDFYSTEWEKTHQAYQREADRCRALMLQQVEEVKAKQEALRREQEEAHSHQMEMLKQEFESSVTELKKSHEQDLQKMEHMLRHSETLLNEKIESLCEENTALSARLREEEDRRKALADKNQRDSHVLYLEQELESLKVVLEIKTNQLHQQEKKLMQMDRLTESNVKLEESLKKLQQENEDYKARMDKHAALSKQLSSEQAVLQQTLQKESKVNKRLSMENEELLWKLHNGDISSPRRLSPSSPFQSPRNSASFPSSPISPR